MNESHQIKHDDTVLVLAFVHTPFNLAFLCTEENLQGEKKTF